MKKKINFSNLNVKIPLLAGVLLLIALSITSTISIFRAKDTIVKDARHQLVNDADAHAEMITLYFHERIGDIEVIAKHPSIMSSQTNNKDKSQVLETIRSGYGDTYQNIVLVNLHGDVLASAGQNVSTNYRDENWLRQAIEKNGAYYEYNAGTEVVDHNVTYSYPVKNEKNEIIGVVASRMSFKIVDDVLKGIIDDYEKEGIEGSYPYIIDSEGVVIWHPVREKVWNKVNLTKESGAVAKVAKNMIQGKEDSDAYTYPNEKGQPIAKIVGYAPLDENGFKWSIAVTLTESELLEPVKKTTYYLIGSSVIIFVMIAFIIWLVIRRNLKPLVQTIHMLKDIAEGKGDLTQRIIVNSKSEVGVLAGYFNIFIEKVQNIIKDIYGNTLVLNEASSNLISVAETLTATSEEMSAKTTAVSSTVEEISASMSTTAATISGSSDNMNVIATAVEEMSATIRNLASASEQTSVGVGQTTNLVGQISDSINSVSGSARAVSQSVSSVATAVKEINVSLNEVSRNCERSIHITSDAEIKSKDTNTIIEKLNGTSKQIGKIIDVINDIADQTNMLALNAAIEAAGAGEAGKGFAVVANEVKELAKQTAEATEEISHQIERMQTDMTQAVKATDDITDVIKEITQITNTIAAAVTEQSATTGEISTAVVKASEQVNSITHEIGDVAQNAQNAARSIAEASKGVNEIARSASELSIASNEVAQNTENASGKVRDVARASREVSKATDEITENIVEISAASEETATGATDTSKAVKELSEISHKLETLVKQFKI